MLVAMGMKRLRLPMVILGALIVTGALFVAGCGDGDDKPAYCSNVTELEESVGAVGEINLDKDAIATLQDDLRTVRSNANDVVSSARDDFPDETNAVESAVSKLSTTIEQLPQSPSAQDLLPLASEISAVVTTAKDLVNATQSACD